MRGSTMPEAPLALERSAPDFLQLLRRNVQKCFSRADIVPVVVRLPAERLGKQILAFLAMARADVPGADFRLPRIVLRIRGKDLVEELFRLGVLLRFGVHLTDALPVARCDLLAVQHAVEDLLPL